MLEKTKNVLWWPGRAVLRSVLRRMRASMMRTMFDAYRPERHYMRGPGPKSRAMDRPLHPDHAVDSQRG